MHRIDISRSNNFWYANTLKIVYHIQQFGSSLMDHHDPIMTSPGLSEDILEHS